MKGHWKRTAIWAWRMADIFSVRPVLIWFAISSCAIMYQWIEGLRPTRESLGMVISLLAAYPTACLLIYLYDLVVANFRLRAIEAAVKEMLDEEFPQCFESVQRLSVHCKAILATLPKPKKGRVPGRLADACLACDQSGWKHGVGDWHSGMGHFVHLALGVHDVDSVLLDESRPDQQDRARLWSINIERLKDAARSIPDIATEII